VCFLKAKRYINSIREFRGFLKAKRYINNIREFRGFLKAKRYINSILARDAAYFARRGASSCNDTTLAVGGPHARARSTYCVDAKDHRESCNAIACLGS
jgi:hypothetical protein